MGDAFAAGNDRTAALHSPRKTRMPGHFATSHRRAAILLCAALLSACEGAKSPTSISAPTKAGAYSLFDPEAGFIAVGVLTGPLGTYDFHTDAVGGGLAVLNAERSIVFAT